MCVKWEETNLNKINAACMIIRVLAGKSFPNFFLPELRAEEADWFMAVFRINFSAFWHHAERAEILVHARAPHQLLSRRNIVCIVSWLANIIPGCTTWSGGSLPKGALLWYQYELRFIADATTKWIAQFNSARRPEMFCPQKLASRCTYTKPKTCKGFRYCWDQYEQIFYLKILVIIRFLKIKICLFLLHGIIEFL